VYVGHFASALAMKAKEPRAPTWALLLGVGVLDLLFGLFVPLGIERMSVTPGVSPGFSLDFIDWSHSLAMSLVWALVFGTRGWRGELVIAAWRGFAVFSHFLLDLLMHPHDMALWPHGSAHLGLGIWTIHPPLWWFFELGFILLCLAYYVARAKQIGSFGGRAWWIVGVILFLHLFNSPWLAPTK